MTTQTTEHGVSIKPSPMAIDHFKMTEPARFLYESPDGWSCEVFLDVDTDGLPRTLEEAIGRTEHMLSHHVQITVVTREGADWTIWDDALGAYGLGIVLEVIDSMMRMVP